MTPEEKRNLACAAYEAHTKALVREGLPVRDYYLPDFDTLPESVKRAWEAVVDCLAE
jgi:hypothetical protein